MKAAWLLTGGACLALAAADPAPQARRLYDAGDFAGAAAAFRAAVAARPQDAHLHYDLGNALLKSGRLGPAVVSYERAFALDPRDGDVRFNLDFALRKAGEELIPPGTPAALFTLFHALAERELAGLHWLACWAALLLAAAGLARPSLRNPLRAPLAGAALAWALFGGWWALRLSAAPEGPAVIVATTAELRSGPGQNFDVTFTAPEGRRVQVIGETAGWLEIGVLKEGARGWVPAAVIERL